MRKRGAERDAKAGLVATAGGALVELNSETDFVAKNDEFVADRPADRRGRRRGRAPADAEALKAVPLGDSTVGEAVEAASRSRSARRSSWAAWPTSTGPTVAYMHRRAADLPPAVGVLVEYDGDDADAARGAAMQIAAMRPHVRLPRRGPRGRRRQGARDRRGHRARGGQARGRAPQDHRGSAQRLLQGRRAARPAVGHGEQEVGQGRPRRRRRHREAVRPLRGRRLTGVPVGAGRPVRIRSRPRSTRVGPGRERGEAGGWRVRITSASGLRHVRAVRDRTPDSSQTAARHERRRCPTCRLQAGAAQALRRGLRGRPRRRRP